MVFAAGRVHLITDDSMLRDAHGKVGFWNSVEKMTPQCSFTRRKEDLVEDFANSVSHNLLCVVLAGLCTYTICLSAYVHVSGTYIYPMYDDKHAYVCS